MNYFFSSEVDFRPFNENMTSLFFFPFRELRGLPFSHLLVTSLSSQYKQFKISFEIHELKDVHCENKVETAACYSTSCLIFSQHYVN